MSIETLIKAELEKHLDVFHMELINESHLHQGHAGDDGSGQTHFKLMVVSEGFCGCNRIQRQQKIYTILKPAFDKGMHALSLNCVTPQEFSG